MFTMIARSDRRRTVEDVGGAGLDGALGGVHEGAREDAAVDAQLGPHVDPVRHAQPEQAIAASAAGLSG